MAAALTDPRGKRGCVVSNNFIHMLSEDNIDSFLTSCMRAEMYENKRVYMKAIRATLIAIGFTDKFVNGFFREYMERFYSDIDVEVDE